ncbi:carbohydrate ABC transporter permease [Herbiconiux sp. A18JL235]|uniref:Carbohydrate ABC transporter permease n=1 Tax=Herbiconiux sp. A18JL235 TaxID=3152363 RepID=A0AB39BIF7_9MICO
MSIETTLLPLAEQRPEPVGRRRRRGRRTGIRVVLIPFAWSLAIFDVAVLLWVFLGSFKTTRELLFDPWGLPASPQVQNYVDAWNSANLGAGIFNSVVLVLGCSLATILLSAPAAYALSRFRRPSAGMLTVVLVLGLGVPAQAVFIPLYVAFDRIGLTDSVFGLFVIYTGLAIPFTVFLLTGFFRSLPKELEEAAALDGLKPGRTFWTIMLPLTRSGLVTVFILNAISFWGETFFAIVFLRQETTISVSLLQFVKTMQYTGARWDVLFAGIVLVLLPLLVVYIWAGSKIVEGIAAGYGK